MSQNLNDEISKLIEVYNILVRGIESKAINNIDRAYGGIIRAGKGELVENLTKNIIRIAWEELGGKNYRISFDGDKIKIPLKKEYLNKINNNDVKKYITENFLKMYYMYRPDVQTFIDGNLVIVTECKAYTENAMFKRILVDFTLLREIFPKLFCVLFQLESQLGGDYSNPNSEINLGNPSTHTLLSHFDVEVIIITLLEGERKVNRPIHKQEFFKELKQAALKKAVNIYKTLLEPFI